MSSHNLTSLAGRRRGPGLDVAVVGGGMGGAAAVLALARLGLKCCLIDRAVPEPWSVDDEVDLRVVGLAPSSVALLDELGVWPAIRAGRTGIYRKMHVWDAATGASIDFDAASRGEAELGRIVENRLVQSALWQALDAAGVRRLCPARVTGVEQREDRINLRLAEPVDESGDLLSARLVVAADGSDSPLREMAGIDVRRRDYGQIAVVAHVRTERPHADTAWQRFLGTGPVALLPLADGRSSLVWSLPVDEARRVLALPDDAFMQELGVATDFRLGRILDTTERAGFPLRLQLAQSYVAGRMVLLGDAAHTVHPLAGQGVNLGLRDVVELRNCLQQGLQAGLAVDTPEVLARYGRRRQSANTLDALSFDGLARIYGWQSLPAQMLRGLGIRLVDRLGPLKRRLLDHASG
ncbi:UbiH/UbiF/VisC/COQ6 family ubiquinone biosynthesis hydroxylase [Frateuria aurantia]|uniref:Ubiquinone biosynthesis hydroxylase, UbiH/UbiF/VisC/COQ6 family n=1 Tax=Frateuria aurantia (strain ATCC 33424 / DSM 6220 / KCTC 2777 / LMG 1558 / NBRC 3245 / NCIMB 13370) TaxID=767434 RepID=H8L3S3_FRAAD|nr:UbiH/UbiF/VisC/COQ6 family ubiquinone biosynthesis hydroxylase [Frateuria aurantia]AFC84878.1 Ubiquinone biosynthesis hydroxylase, UbiH/UbiF/VisC/COQ6 family [Frateuria aurantia DSM 6220]